MKIKILHIVYTLGTGGLENGVINIINNSDDRFEHVVCCLREKGLMAQRIIKPDITIYSLKKKTRDYLMPWKLRNIIKRENPDIVHTRNWGTIDGVIGAKLAGAKNIIHGEHGRDIDDAAGNNFKRNTIRRLLSGSIERFITVSEDLNNWLVNTVGIKQEKVITILNGVDTSKFLPISANKKSAKLNVDFDPKDILIGSIGRFDKVKNYPLFINALAELKRGGCNCKGCIIGYGTEKDILEKHISESGAPVTLIGRQDNVVDYLHAFDVFVLPSFNEGISNTILEAMSCGLPVIATRVGGNPELIEDGHSGYLVQSGDVANLSIRINELVNDAGLRNTLGDNARNRCLDKFSLQSMVNNYEELYFELVSST